MITVLDRKITHNSDELDPFNDDSNILLKESNLDTNQLCSAIHPGPTTVNTLVVTEALSIDEVVHAWRSHPGRSGDETLAVVSIGETVRSAATQPTPQTLHGGPIEFTSVPSVEALDEIGYAIDRYLTDWSKHDTRIMVCFHALDSLLNRIDRLRVVRFLAAVIERAQTAQAAAHYHINPTDHDPRTITRVESLFAHRHTP